MKKSNIRVVKAGIIFCIVASVMMTSVQGISVSYETPNVKKLDQKQWTTLFYLDYDYGTVPYDALEAVFIDEIFSSDSVNVVVLQDTLDKPAFVYYIDEDHNKTVLEEWGEVNMADYITLKDFIEYGKDNYPADHYLLWVVNHGGAWKGACIDETNNGLALTMDGFQKALSETGGVDVICFFACLMASLEAVYELRDLVEVYVGSEDLAYGSSWDGVSGDINQMLTDFPESSSEEVGEGIVDSFVAQANPPFQKLSISAIRANKIEPLVDNLNSLVKYYMTHWLRSYNKVRKAYDNTFLLADMADWAAVFEVYDLKGFIDNLPETERTQTVLEAFDEAIIALAHGADEVEAQGLSVFFQASQSPYKLYRSYVDTDLGLDFPKDTLWNEFLLFFILTNRLFLK